MITASLDLDRERGIGVILLTNAAQKLTAFPGGRLYKKLHAEAVAMVEARSETTGTPGR